MSCKLFLAAGGSQNDWPWRTVSRWCDSRSVHAYVHVLEIGSPVNIMGMQVAQGELIHADRHGAIVVPDEVIPKLGSAIETVIETEQIVLGPAREPGFDIDALEAAWAKFEQART